MTEEEKKQQQLLFAERIFIAIVQNGGMDVLTLNSEAALTSLVKLPHALSAAFYEHQNNFGA